MIDNTNLQDNRKSIFSLTDHELYVISAIHGGKANGQIATWIMPASLVPDIIRLVAVISPTNYTHDVIRQSQCFAISMLSKQQLDLVSHFGLKSGKDVDKFASIDCEYTPLGIPIPKGSCGWIECSILESMNSGDRMIYYAEGMSFRTYPDQQPLRKKEAFSTLPRDVRASLQEKQFNDGQRDKASIRDYREP
jgi:flavin reductase (DIM6/NTAB) family NADH-FMN oxidoreductase RutF